MGLTSCKAMDSLRMAGPPPQPLGQARPKLGPKEIAITWLGAAGVLVRGRDKTVAVDPYVTRANLAVMTIGNLHPDTKAIDRWIPKTDLVLVGHSHADHVLDVAHLMKRDGAHVVGSLSAANVVRSYGAPVEQVHVVGGGELLNIQGVTVEAVRAGHGKILGRVPQKGHVNTVEPGPLKGEDFKLGTPFFYRFIVDGVRIGHLSSGELGKAMPHDLGVDVLLVSMAATKDRDVLLKNLLERTHPMVVMPIHFDMFFLDLEQTPRRLPGYDVDEVAVQVSTLAPKAHTLIPEPMREFIINSQTGKSR